MGGVHLSVWAEKRYADNMRALARDRNAWDAWIEAPPY
ncbi:unnamed protein product [Nezara viridula]|uniref:Uncharacterized protein n=1 Tax=Nezara viridula TaxID=85310 RepID=A0A9P0H392_NEZVI|nr:unnamed protein product [Nezara viridula]